MSRSFQHLACTYTNPNHWITYLYFYFFSSDNNSVQSHTKHCEIVPSLSLDDSSLDQDEETITNAQKVSVYKGKVNSLESQSEVETENGVIGIDAIPSLQEAVDSPEIVLSLDVKIVSTIEPGSPDETISREVLSDTLKFSFEGDISKGVRENRDGNEKVTETNVGEKLSDETKFLGIAQYSTLEGRNVGTLTPEFSHERENISQVKDLRKKVIDGTDIDVLNFKDENFIDHDKHADDLTTSGEVEEILSEEQKETGEGLELRTINEVEGEILSEEEKESGEGLELRTISEVEAEIVFEEKKENEEGFELRTISGVEAEILSEEEKESGEGLELRTIGEVETSDFTCETSAVKHVNEEVDEVVNELSNIQEVTLKENICKDVDDSANLEETADEVGEVFSKEIDNMVQEVSTDRERVSKIVSDIADETESITQVKEILVAGDRNFEFCLKEGIVRKLTSAFAPHVLETIKEVKEIPTEKSGQEFYERIEDKQDVLESSHENDDSDIDGVTRVEGEILLNEEVPSNTSEKMCLKSAYKSDTGIERSRAVKDNGEDHCSERECLQEVKSVSLVIGDFTLEDDTVGNQSLPIKEELDGEITVHELTMREKNEPPDKNPKKIASQMVLDTENIHETALELGYKTEADAGEVKSFAKTPTNDYGTDHEMFKLKANKEVDHRDARYRLLEHQSVSIVMSEHALEEESVDDQNFSDNGKMFCKINNKLAIEVKNQPPNKNLIGVISGNILEAENSAKGSYQTLNSTEQPSYNLDDATSIKHCSLGLNASAKEFVPSKSLTPKSIFRGADGGPSSIKDSEQNGVKKNPENAARLNAEAKEYTPSLQARVRKNKLAGNSQSCMFPKDFVPSYVNNVPSQQRFPHEINHAPAMRPVYRPASSHQVPGFRPRGHARMHHRRPAGRFPPNQPRMRFRHRNPPNTVRWQTWSSFD